MIVPFGNVRHFPDAKLVVSENSPNFYLFEFDALSDEEKRNRIDRNNPKSPFSRFIGNEKAVKKLQTAAYNALEHENHIMSKLAFGLYGPTSSGKTTLARLYAETVQLPFLEISPKSIRTLDDFHQQVVNLQKSYNIPMNPFRDGDYILPPTVILIDEVHALSNHVVQGLLKAIEYNDALLVTESGVKCHTWFITWMIATTDEGMLFDAFRSRFSAVNLKYLSKDDIAKIVHNQNPDLSMDICKLIAHYNSRIPRKALEFTRYVKMCKAMGGSWESCIHSAASDEGIDEYGMHESHLVVLKALGNGPIARNRISIVTGKKEEECERFILPWLLSETEDQSALVTVTKKGYTITEAGLQELDKRKIHHKVH
jgi:Holliday junction resolvasome RuvABC ATP-dependent DNA helicase subunit